MTTNQNDSRDDQRKRDERKTSTTGASESADHRLRGVDQAADFSDAEGDSCIVARKRDEKESDS